MSTKQDTDHAPLSALCPDSRQVFTGTADDIDPAFSYSGAWFEDPGASTNYLNSTGQSVFGPAVGDRASDEVLTPQLLEDTRGYCHLQVSIVVPDGTSFS